MGARARRYSAVPLAACLAACDGGAGPSGGGRIAATVTADASAPPGVGYTLTLDGADARLLPGPGTVVYTGVAPGTHSVLLFGLPEGCEVRGANPLHVDVFDDATTAVGFSVSCAPPATGGFRIQVTTVGEPLDDDGYQLSVAGAPLRTIEVNALESFEGLAPGVHLVTLKDVIPECRLEGGNPQPFTVVPGKSVLVRLRVTCGNAGEEP